MKWKQFHVAFELGSLSISYDSSHYTMSASIIFIALKWLNTQLYIFNKSYFFKLELKVSFLARKCNNVLLWTPTHGCASVGRPARTYIQQLCEDTGCNPEDLPEAMSDREKWRETVRDIRAGGATWWWWWWECKYAPIFASHKRKVHAFNLAVCFVLNLDNKFYVSKRFLCENVTM